MTRLDQWLVQLGLVRSRTQASELIRRGLVSVHQEKEWATCTRPSQKFSSLSQEVLQIKEHPVSKYVSRAGAKLEGALQELNFNVEDLIAVDVGQSTGGFSHCLLQKKAKWVIGLDVGHGQLSEELKNHDRLTALEGVNARNWSVGDLQQELEKANLGKEKTHLVVMDVSFISICELIPVIATWLGRGSKLLSLVKPQFELSAKQLGKGGLVREKKLYDTVREKVILCAEENGFKPLSYLSSQIEGGDGNQEFFLYAEKI